MNIRVVMNLAFVGHFFDCRLSARFSGNRLIASILRTKSTVEVLTSLNVKPAK
jgi:hypothetical protein